MSESNNAQEFIDGYLDSVENSEKENTVPVDTKVIQIVLEENLPLLQYQNMSIPEIIGVLDMTKKLLLERYIKTPVLKSNLQDMVNSIK